LKLLFEKSVPGRKGFELPVPDVPENIRINRKFLTGGIPELPEIGELEVVRHFTRLASYNFSVDANFYPLGSCTMKYNPKITEKIAALEGFTDIHPLTGMISGAEKAAQGALEILYELQEILSEITGMEKMTLQPLAGAQGELAGMLMVRAYHDFNRNEKKTVIVPDESHGTNPASAAMAGYEIVTVSTAENGQMNLEEFKEKIGPETAAVIMTCPNTLGIYNTDIKEICDIAHSHGALMYYDGANLNAVLGKVRPGDLGFDITHVNLHKTFGTPHGGGGPGAGPVGVKKELVPFLPGSLVEKTNTGSFRVSLKGENSIGRLAPFYGNFSVLLKAYAYILLLGRDGLNDVSNMAVLNTNYLMEKLKSLLELPYERRCMHECVFSAENLPSHVNAMDIAKFLIDKGIHPPTVYFPLIVKEALMVEPTETETLEELDNFIDAVSEAVRLAGEAPEKLKSSPVSMRVGRLDETKAARELDVNYD